MNEKINKVIFKNETLIDLTEDTVTADKILQGFTAHDRSGAEITGTAGASVSGTNLSIPSSIGTVNGTNLSLV